MKRLILMFFLAIILAISYSASAQNNYTITGTITGENQKPIIGATIFIGGTKLATATNTGGKFEIIVPSAGSYHLLVKMLGYAPASKDVMLKEQTVNLDIALTVSTITLHEVKIGSDKDWARNYELFKKDFLGADANARACEIKNPEIINFSTKKGELHADADDFLIIENKRLGYRVKYLLKTFQDDNKKIVAYSGDAIFEDLQGTDEQKQEWKKNRANAYRGSMMHFFRSVFTNTALQEGFITSQMYESKGKRYYNSKPVLFDTLVTAVDTAFIAMKFTSLYINYDPAKAATLLKSDPNAASQQMPVSVENGSTTASELVLYLKDPIIVDASGALFSGYLLSFLIRGDWINRRLGDQLPFEYQPPATTSP